MLPQRASRGRGTFRAGPGVVLFRSIASNRTCIPMAQRSASVPRALYLAGLADSVNAVYLTGRGARHLETVHGVLHDDSRRRFCLKCWQMGQANLRVLPMAWKLKGIRGSIVMLKRFSGHGHD